MIKDLSERTTLLRSFRTLGGIASIFISAGLLYFSVLVGVYLVYDKTIFGYFPAKDIDPRITNSLHKYIDYQNSQLAGAELWRKEKPLTREFGLILGTSSVRSNIDPIIFKNARAKEMEWVVTGQIGPSFVPMKKVLDMLSTFPNFKPSEIILGIHPYMIKGYGPWYFKENNKRDNTFWSWLKELKQHSRAAIHDSLYSLKYRIFSSIDQSYVNVLHNPIPNPWWPLKSNLVESYSEAQWEEDKQNGRLDWALEENGYNAQAEGVRTFSAAIDTILESWNSSVVVVFMPQVHYMNRDMPEEAYRVIMNTLSEKYSESVKIIDMRGAYEERDFFDPAHLNNFSKKRFSEDLGEIYRKKLKESYELTAD